MVGACSAGEVTRKLFMEMRYRNTLEDLIAFSKYHHSHSDIFRKRKRRATVYSPIILLILMILLFALEPNAGNAVGGFVFVAFCTFFFHRAYTTGLYKTIRRTYEAEDMTGFICEHTLEVNDEVIIEKTDVNERRDRWLGVQKIETDNNYAFIYIGALQAHIIPRKNIIEGNFDEFIEAARSYWQKAKLNRANATNA